MAPRTKFLTLPVAAATVIAELGDITRFANPRQLMAYLGLVPSEHSSGATRRQGGITNHPPPPPHGNSGSGSRNLSTKRGSLDSLNWRIRCGCRPWARQMRRTELTLSPAAFAIKAPVQWV